MKNTSKNIGVYRKVFAFILRLGLTVIVFANESMSFTGVPVASAVGSQIDEVALSGSYFALTSLFRAGDGKAGAAAGIFLSLGTLVLGLIIVSIKIYDYYERKRHLKSIKH